ncbi:MAG TPA: protein kinase [Gemmatimonadaceae bacterium]|nr:protein kinase [Gemmatimonadaceae bacterium]
MPSKCPQCGAAIADDSIFCNKCGFNVTREHAAVTAAAAQAGLSGDIGTLATALADRYKVERELGRGGMATVYLAHDLKHDREVAIKVLHPDLAATLGGDRFEREIKLAAKLQHPHILGLYDSGVAKGLLYYVMPFVKGESLRDKIVKDKMLTIEDAERFTLEVADALGYAHAQGIVHRDIKPENVMLSNGHALVMDFGIARAIGEAGSGGGKLTQTGMSVGTPVYMAPEQASGEPAGPTADIYSLGCMLYEMLAGEPPFTGANQMAIMAKHLMEQPPSVRVVRNTVPEEIENAIFAAMAKAPVDRPQTAAAFAELMGLPLGATATMRVMRGTGSMRRVTGTGAQAILEAPSLKWYQKPAVLIGGVAAVAAVVAAVVVSNRPKRTVLADDPNARRLAVLYFNDLSKDSSLTPVADGLTEGLTRTLSTSSSFTVLATSGAARFRGTAVGVDSIARALRAGYLVRGDVEPEAGDKVRVTVRLDDASGAKIDQASLTVPKANVITARDTLAVVVGDLIRKRLGQEFQTSSQRASTSSEESWLLVQRGEAARRSMEGAYLAADTAAVERWYHAADSLYAAAEAGDAKWSEPEGRRALAAYRRSRMTRDPNAIKKWIGVGLPHADKAIEVDANDADALEVRGNLKYWGWLSNIEVDPTKKAALIESARADLEKSRTLNNKQAGAYATLSHLYNNSKGTGANDVLIAAQRAYEADEFLAEADRVLARLVLAAYDLGNADQADQWCAEANRRFPSTFNAVRCRLLVLTMKGKTPDVPAAWRLADSVAALAPNPKYYRLNSDMLVAAVIAHAAQNNPALGDSAKHVIKRSEGDASVDPTRDLALYGAIAATALGDKAEAVRLLKTYFAVNPQKVAGFREDPGWQFRDLIGDPGFKQLVGG